MAQDSKIEWTKHTINLWWGCVSVHEGCTNCYAEVLSNRWGHDVWGNDKPRKEIKSVWNDLIKYQKLAKEAGEMHRVFVGSMMDIFEKPMPLIDSKRFQLSYDTNDVRQQFWKVVEQSPNLMFLLLTKRPSNINKYIPESWKINPPSNVMFGTSPVNQETADKLIPQLLEVKGKHFLSIEPMLDKIDISKYLWGKSVSCCGECGTKDNGKYCQDCGDPATTPCDNEDCQFKKINWVICGGESGHSRRPFNLDWARSLRDQCKTVSIPFFFKQIDKVNKDIPADLQIRQFPNSK